MDVRVGRVHGWVVGLAALATFGLIVGTVMAHGKAVHRTSPTGPSATATATARPTRVRTVTATPLALARSARRPGTPGLLGRPCRAGTVTWR